MARTESTRMLANFLQERFGRVWVYPPGTRAFGKLELPTHRIAVNGWFPDVLCLLPDDRIVAVVAELEAADIMRGVGRAVALKGGVHAVLLAAEAEELARVRDTVLGVGVGLCAVGPGADVRVEFPRPDDGPGGAYPQHQDVLRELEVLDRRTVRRRFTSLVFDHPLHYAAAVLAIRPGTPQAKQDVASLLLERWGFGGPQTEAWWNVLYGALFLGLVREWQKEEALQLTDLGEQTRTALLTRYSAAELKELTQHERPLCELSPNVAFLLRSLYFSEPDAGLILKLLMSFVETKVHVSKLLALVMQRHPNAAANLFIRAEAQNHYAEAWREGRLNDLLNSDQLKQILNPSVYGPFKRQLIHLGVLDVTSLVWEKDQNYNPDKDFWVRRI